MSLSTRSLIDISDDNPWNDWSWVKRFLRMRSPFSLIVHWFWMFNGAHAPPSIFVAVSSLIGSAYA